MMKKIENIDTSPKDHTTADVLQAKKDTSLTKTEDKTSRKWPSGAPDTTVDDVENAMEAMFAGVQDTMLKSEAERTKAPPIEKELTPASAKAKKLTEKKKTQIYQSKLSLQDKLLSKFAGPFLHVEGSLSSPSWSNVVNSALDSISPAKKNCSKGINEVEQRRVVQGMGHASTLSNTYNVRKPDESWVCVFCKRPSHFQGLGDLFGPYFVSNSVAKSSSIRSLDQKALAAKFIVGGDSSKRKKKRKSSESKEQHEVWFHEDCVCWLPEISLIGSRLLGLEAAIDGAEVVTCGRCRNSGATMVCLRAGCKESVHFGCAVEGGWRIKQEEIEAFCSQHA